MSYVDSGNQNSSRKVQEERAKKVVQPTRKVRLVKRGVEKRRENALVEGRSAGAEGETKKDLGTLHISSYY